jgi:hypothetical protein
MQRAQEELACESVTASAGGGVVKATMTGGLELVSVEIALKRERKTHGNPNLEAKAWAETLLEAERKQDGCQEMLAADVMALDELRAKLDALEETRKKTARREIAVLSG